jgi:hypothetical protein
MERSQSTRQESCQMAKLCEGPMFPGGMMGHYYYYYLKDTMHIVSHFL